jgi:regulator of sigma E protease
MLTSLVVFLIFFFALSFMIFIHELGHFIASRWAGVEVEEFGFGLPSKKLVTLFTWQGTEFTIHALPLGGFVRPKGENDPNVPGGLAAASPWKRLVVLFAGPLMNLATAVVIFSILVALQGTAVPGKVLISSVMEDSPAEAAGIKSGDILVAINGEEVTEIQATIDLIKSNLDQPAELLFDRNGKTITLTVTPLSERDKANQGALGVGLSYPTRAATAVEVISGGFAITGVQAAVIVYLPVAIVQGVIAPEDARVVGFKGIFDMFHFAVQEDVSSRQEAATAPAGTSVPTTNTTLLLIGMLSVSLGVMNLLPIPALDGGRILFTLPEILFKRRIPPERENMVNGIAMLLLIALMIFINVMDFVNPAQFPPR